MTEVKKTKKVSRQFPCSDPRCLGWDIFDAGGVFELQRCDECKKFRTDDEAAHAAITWINNRKEKA